LPQPFGPTIQVMPEPLKVIGVFSQNDLKRDRNVGRVDNLGPSAWRYRIGGYGTKK
jgi:hypothetical protein